MAHPNISKESELQALLTDERERSRQFKQLYQTLKEEHSKLKDELTFVHQQLKEAVLKNKQIQETKDSYIKKLEEQLREKQREISNLSEEVRSYDPQKIKNSVLDEATNHYENKITEIQAETDKMKEEYFNLRREHSHLKCKLESQKSEFSHVVERLKLQHLNEIEQLQHKIETLEKEKSSPDDNTAIDLKTAKRDILELNSKLKGLLAECEELRAKNENLTLQLSNTSRMHSKQHADNLNNIRSLESEKQKALMQKEVLERELSNLQEQKRILNNELQASKREILVLTTKLEDCEHNCHMITTDLQVENIRLKNEYQSEKEVLTDEITRIKSELRDLSAELNHTHQVLMSKEQELQQNSAMARQQLWNQAKELQEEKERCEKKFQDFKNQKEQIVLQLNREIQVLHQDLQIYSESKLKLEKELSLTKEKLEEILKNSDSQAIEMLSKQNLEYQQQIQLLKEQINHLKSSSNVYFEEKDKLLNEMLLRRKAEVPHEMDREVLELKLNWEQQKHQFHQRIQDLESQLKDIKNSSAAEKEKLEQKIEQYSRQVNKLKDKLAWLKSKKDELETLKETLSKNVPVEIHMQVKSKLTELQRRLEQYRLIVAAEPHFSGCTKTSTVVSEKLLTDINNLQLRLPPPEDLSQDYTTVKFAREKQADKAKKTSHYRRRPLTTRNGDVPSKTISPTITSSSDLESENL